MTPTPTVLKTVDLLVDVRFADPISSIQNLPMSLRKNGTHLRFKEAFDKDLAERNKRFFQNQ